MRKVTYDRFGDESVLKIAELPVPDIQDNQLLIRVKAAAINPLDWKLYRGEMKMMSGSKFPKSVGIDFSGIIEKKGSAVSRFEAGDAVLGMMPIFKGGALADYVVVGENDITLKPKDISFEQAAALPSTGLSALQIIDSLAAITKNQEVLINGATGGVGVFAVQIARQRGARVTAVVSSKGVAEAMKLGADVVIDYDKQNIMQLTQRYDAIIDLSTKLPFKDAKRLMKKSGTFVTTVPSPALLLQSFFNNLFSKIKLKVLILKPSVERLNELSDLAGKGLHIVLDKTYSINEVQPAYREASRSKIIGKSVFVND